MISDNRQIGFGLSAGGIAFMGLGILLFFDSRLIAIGNAMFFTGVILILGVQGTMRLFARCGFATIGLVAIEQLHHISLVHSI